MSPLWPEAEITRPFGLRQQSRSPASGWASSGRCLRGYPRGASPIEEIVARDDRYEVNLPVVPAGTPSACAEASLNGSGGFCRHPLEFSTVSPNGVHDDGEFARDGNGCAFPTDTFGKSKCPGTTASIAAHLMVNGIPTTAGLILAL